MFLAQFLKEFVIEVLYWRQRNGKHALKARNKLLNADTTMKIMATVPRNLWLHVMWLNWPKLLNHLLYRKTPISVFRIFYLLFITVLKKAKWSKRLIKLFWEIIWIKPFFINLQKFITKVYKKVWKSLQNFEILLGFIEL